ncbi:hypothetical protein P7C70_g6432, partial [Phenoliferia sp. Uapishka_3]
MQQQQQQPPTASSADADEDPDAIPSTTLTPEEAQTMFRLANQKRRSSSDLGRTVLVEEPEEIEVEGEASTKSEPNSHSAPMRRPTTGPKPGLFDLAHSRHSSHHKVKHDKVHIHGFEQPLSWRHLFKPPVVRQWLSGGVLARETAEREAARFELFFDLAFVGVIHQLAEGASESESSWAIFKFIVLFYLAYSVWTDVLLLGYSSNAAAINIECPTEATEVIETAVRLLRRATEEGEGQTGTEGTESHLTLLPGGCELNDGWRKNVRAAVAFFLVAKLLRIAQCALYGYYLPRFRKAHLVRAGSLVIGSAFYLPLLGVKRPIDFLVLPIIAITLELSAAFTVPLSVKALAAIRKLVWRPSAFQALPLASKSNSFSEKKEQKDEPGQLTPALNLEHMIERNALFVVLVLGEMILNVTFKAAGSESGIHEEYLRCVLGLFIAYFLNWIYADNDASRTFLHAIRRHWLTSITWGHLHFPLTAALILASAALPSLVGESHPGQRIRWYFGGGLGTTLLSLALLGFCHKSLDADGSALISHHYRLIARLVVGVIFATIPLAKSLSSTALLAIYAGTLFALVLAETIGKFGSKGSHEKIKLALSSQRVGKPSEQEFAIHPEHSIHLEAALHEEHEHGLTEHELGEDDVGNEGALGNIRVTKIGRRQRLAYAF